MICGSQTTFVLSSSTSWEGFSWTLSSSKFSFALLGLQSVAERNERLDPELTLDGGDDAKTSDQHPSGSSRDHDISAYMTATITIATSAMTQTVKIIDHQSAAFRAPLVGSASVLAGGSGILPIGGVAV